ncbi:MAG: hypothetical protein IIB03_05780 [Acidobacteria bacterium]|nr:hypothetical protein [Acidobacteriota bacterium]
MKAERRHELRENDLLHAMGVAKAYINENGGRIGLVIIGVFAVAMAVMFGMRSRAAAQEDIWRQKSEFSFSDGDVGRVSLSELATLTSSTDDEQFILQSLLELHIDAQTLAALALVPLIEVAWADGYLDEKEKQAVLEAAHASGFEKGQVAYEVLESWLTQQPKPKLLETWVEYIRELRGQLSEEEHKSLKASLLGRARSVAEASGGYLGLGFKVSKTEAAVLKTLDEACWISPTQ